MVMELGYTTELCYALLFPHSSPNEKTKKNPFSSSKYLCTIFKIIKKNRFHITEIWVGLTMNNHTLLGHVYNLR